MVTFNELLKIPEFGGFIVVAGREGLAREISAMSVMDAPDSYKWLEGGEFILTSAYLYANDPETLAYVAEKLIAAGCAGLGIKKGRFLTEIPDEVIRTAEKHSFPIIQIPYGLTFPIIFSHFYRLLYAGAVPPDANTQSAQPDANATSVPQKTAPVAENAQIYAELLQSLKAGRPCDKICRAISGDRDSGKTTYSAILLLSGSDVKEIYLTLCDVLGSGNLKKAGEAKSYVRFEESSSEAAVLLEVSKLSQIEPYEWLYMLCEEIGHHDFDGRISAGRLYSDIGDIGKSYSEALDAIIVGRSIVKKVRCHLYYSMSYLCILYREKLDKVDLSLIDGFMADGDSVCEDALKTLEAHISCDNRQELADILHLHRNSISARLEKMSDYFHFDVTKPANRLTLAVLLFIWRLKNEAE